MEFILKTVFDYNLERKRKIVQDIGNQLRSVLSIRSYSKMVEEINIDLYWTPNAIKVRRPIYHEDKTVKVFPHDKNNDATFRMYHLLFVDIPLPEEFVTCSEEEAVPMIGQTLMKYFTETPLPLKIRNSFDKERFISDLQSFFATYKQKT
jgi:hypothetical protein